MKNLLNCHCIGLHSFPISIDKDMYKRVFYAEENHRLWKPFEIAVHPHHVDIKITVLDGEICNPLFSVDENGPFVMNKFKWNSHILNGKGGFELLGKENMNMISSNRYAKGDVIIMKACELHTVQIKKGEKAVWLIEESIPSCEYFPLNYSTQDLSEWNSFGLYIEVSDEVKDSYLKPYYNLINTIL